MYHKMKLLVLMCISIFIMFDLYHQIHAYKISNIPKTLFRKPLSSKILPSKLYNQKNTNNIQQDDHPTVIKKDTNLIEYIIDALDQGKVEELSKKGFGVTKLTNEYETELEYKLNDPEIQAKILGPSDEEDLELLQLLEDGKAWVINNEINPNSISDNMMISKENADIIRLELNDINEELLVSLQAEAKETINSYLDTKKSTESDFIQSEIATSITETIPDVKETSLVIAEDLISNSNSNEAAFASLLKATISDVEVKTESKLDDNNELILSTLNAVNDDTFQEINVKGILGEAIYSLTSSLGIDIEAEIAQSPQTKLDLQNIMKNSMAELAVSMKELDQESNNLFNKLDTLKTELQQETEAFEATKQLELDELLTSQSQLQSEYTNSQVYMQDSTDKLAKILSEVNENADIITSLALFRIRSIDQKIAFVIGLSLLFKIPYDVSNLLAIRSFDFTNWFTIFTQSGVCLACFNHYGLLRAILVTLNKPK